MDPLENEDKLAPIEDLDDSTPEVQQPRLRYDVSSCPRGKLHSFNWLEDIPGGFADSQLVEVQFKNTRKGFYRNTTKLQLKIGDYVAVEATPGHDIGRVSMVGKLVEKQMPRANFKHGTEIKRVFRLARPNDMEKYHEACAKEADTMIRARKIAESLNLSMKIGDVEYQGDGNKAIFYYIADERVDFRQLIKILAEVFKVRIEMRQIGARQEAGRIGGIGPCGRPLCCSSWMTSFVSVATSAARYQDISLNPQKLAGQCAKLKCCLNFEIDTYVESMKRMPPKDARLETTTGTYYHFKTDIFKREITYSSDKSVAANLVTITASRAFDVIAMNKAGEKPESLLPEGEANSRDKRAINDILGEGDLTRFDKKKKKKPRDKGPRANDRQNRKQKDPQSKAPKPQDGDKQPKALKPQDGDKQPKAPKTQDGDKQPKGPKTQDGDKQPKGPRPQRQGDRPGKGPRNRQQQEKPAMRANPNESVQGSDE